MTGTYVFILPENIEYIAYLSSLKNTNLIEYLQPNRIICVDPM